MRLKELKVSILGRSHKSLWERLFLRIFSKRHFPGKERIDILDYMCNIGCIR